MLTSDIDVFQEYLPASLRRDFDAPVDLAAALVEVTSAAVADIYDRHAAAVMARLDRKTSEQRFVDGLLGGLDADD